MENDNKDGLRLVYSRSTTLQERLDLVLRARGKQRERLIVSQKDAEAIVRAIPEEEFYYTIKEIGEEDATALLALATPQQITFCLDIEGWHGDRVDPKGLLHWIGLILDCGEPKAWEFLQEMDDELLVVFLKGHMTVIKPDEGKDPVEIDEDYFTLDQQYYIKFRGFKGEQKVIPPLLDLLFRKDYDRYFRIMEGVIWGITAEEEELAFRWRQGRLMDKGFPDLEGAMQIYQWVDPTLVKIEQGKKDLEPQLPLDERWQGISPAYYLAPLPPDNLLSQALKILLNSNEGEGVKEELVYLCNKAMVADRIDISNLEAVRETIASVYRYLNIGLAHLAAGDLQDGVKGLQRLYLHQIFQVGFSLTLRLRRKMERLLKDSWFSLGKGYDILDPPYGEIAEGLMRRKPLFFAGLIDPQHPQHRPFSDLKEISLTEEKLREIELLLRLHREVYGFPPEGLRAMDLSACHPSDWREITFSTITLTAIANLTIKGDFSFSPIGTEGVREFMRRTLAQQGGSPAINKDFLGWLKGKFDEMLAGSYPWEQEWGWGFWTRCLDRFREEFGYLDPTQSLTPPYTKGLLIALR